ncbi:unnamed protein product [Clonostachys rhizophaga]|uniref:Uncharacterized protein n=1 Tax=Clonostachys rhizophaga TaxID=160324 RepID=A0A9N9W436_9HYPO|nr:unnamed protein product [Clonostachys rhizophaga]
MDMSLSLAQSDGLRGACYGHDPISPEPLDPLCQQRCHDCTDTEPTWGSCPKDAEYHVLAWAWAVRAAKYGD